MSEYQSPPIQPDHPHLQKSGNNTVKILVIVFGVIIVVMMLMCVLLAVLLLPAVTQVRAAAQRTDAANSARMVILAMHNYHDTQNRMPPAYTTAEDGTRLHSWRTLILPFVEQNHVYDQIDLESPWDSGSNQKFNDSYMPAFESVRGETKDAAITHFVAVVDENTLLQPGTSIALASVPDGTSNTAVLIEYPASDIRWMEPRDITIDEAIDIIQNGQLPGGVNVAFADGSVMAIRSDTSAEDIRNLFTVNDGNAVNLFD